MVLTKYEEHSSHELLESRKKQELKQSRMLFLPGTTGKSRFHDDFYSGNKKAQVFIGDQETKGNTKMKSAAKMHTFLYHLYENIKMGGKTFN